MEKQGKLIGYFICWRGKYNSDWGNKRHSQSDNLMASCHQDYFRLENSAEMYKKIQEGKYPNNAKMIPNYQGKDGKCHREKGIKIGFSTSTITKHPYEKRRLHENIKK